MQLTYSGNCYINRSLLNISSMNTKHLLIFGAFATTTLITTSCRSTLYRAARDGDIQTVRSELTNNADPEGTASAANLIWQVPAGIVAIPVDAVQLVLGIATKGDYFKLDTPVFTQRVFKFRGKTAMYVAGEKGNVDIMRELMLAGASSSEWDKAKVLSEAARRGDTKTVSLLIEKGVNANSSCDGDYNPIMLAIGNGHEECARLLLAKGANLASTVTIQNNVISCYDYAVSKGQVGLFKKLGGKIVASPKSVAGKRIVFDFSGTTFHDRDDSMPEGQWNTWSKGSKGTTTTLTFGKNNKAERKGKYVDDFIIWNYKKTGAKTAEITHEEHEYGAKYYLTFDSATTGTAAVHEGGEGQERETVGVRFTIK